MLTRATILTAALLAAVFVCNSSSAHAGDWMFKRSYFSHSDQGANVNELPAGRSGYRQPFAGAHPRFAIRGGWRINSIVISNGYSSDRTFIRENWFDANY